VASGPPCSVSGFRLRARLGLSIPSTLPGPRGITPAFGYGAPHSSARGTSTLLSKTRCSAHNMPSADFCPAVRLPCDSLSPLRTQGRSPGVSSSTFRAQSPDIRFAPLMDMDFAVFCPLVRHWRLISGFCPSTRTFAIRFLQTPPRGGSPCVLASPSPPSGWAGDLQLTPPNC